MLKLKTTICLNLLILLFMFFTSVNALAGSKILCTTFPIYQITRNVVQTDKDVQIELMLPSQMGCPHGYTLSPIDMKKIATADIMIINGLGMEEFLGAPTNKANPNIHVIDSSIGITKTIKYTKTNAHHHECNQDHKHNHKECDHNHKDNHEHHCCNHHHSGVNPHLFASPRMVAQIALNIAGGLSKITPEKASIYFKEAVKYANTMNLLADEAAKTGSKLKNKRIIQPHGAFDYLAKDMGIHIIATMQPHGQKPSAAEMMNLVRRIKKRKVGAIFTEPQYPDDSAQALSKETAVPVIVVDPVATGPENADLNYYETIMKKNFKLIEKTLGTK